MISVELGLKMAPCAASAAQQKVKLSIIIVLVTFIK